MALMVSKGENKGRAEGGEERENGSGSDEEYSDRSGRHGRQRIGKNWKEGRKKEENKKTTDILENEKLEENWAGNKK